MKLTNNIMNILGIQAVVVATKRGDAPCAVTDAVGNIWVCFVPIPIENKGLLIRIKSSDGFLRFRGCVISTLPSDKPS